MSATDQLRRILHLIPALGDDREHRVDDVARIAGVDRSTLLGDLRLLAGRTQVPGGFVDGFSVWLEGETVSLHASHFLRPMRLTRSEVLALDLGLAMLRGERPPEEHAALDRARDRLRDVLARLPREVVEDGDHHAATGAAVAPELLRALRTAARKRCKLQLAYHKPDAPAAQRRTVCPYAVVFARGMWYLVAHCEQSDGLRIFRADRVHDAEVTSERFTVPSEFSVAAVIREGRAFWSEDAGRLVVRYTPNVARWIAEREGRPLDADGSLTVEYPLADVDWAVRHVLQYGRDAEVLEPREARAAVRDRIVAMRRRLPP